MNAGILKIGTMPTKHYWISTNKPISDYRPGDRIKFREQKTMGSWERGIVREMQIDVPFIDRM